jgi:quercetin dioxygenase-like cupin family protein
MAVRHSTSALVTRWQSAQYPTLSNISQLMNREGLTPYHAVFTPNHRQPNHSHGFKKIFYLVEGTLEVNLPDDNVCYVLKVGDRVELPRGVYYSLTVGASGAKCLEASLRPSRATQNT